MIVEITIKNEVFRCRTGIKYDDVKIFIKYILSKKKVKSAKIEVIDATNKIVLSGKLTFKNLSNGIRYYVNEKGLAYLYPNLIKEQEDG